MFGLLSGAAKHHKKYQDHLVNSIDLVTPSTLKEHIFAFLIPDEDTSLETCRENYKNSLIRVLNDNGHSMNLKQTEIVGQKLLDKAINDMELWEAYPMRDPDDFKLVPDRPPLLKKLKSIFHQVMQ